MAKRRIPTKPNELRDQMMQAATGITGEVNWPATGPTSADVNTQSGQIHMALTAVDDLKAQLSQARATLRTERDKGIDVMKKIDQVTDGLYGPDGPEKLNFGLPPKKLTGESVPLVQVIITKIEEGTSPASIFVDWDQQEGAAAYEIEWFTDSALTQKIGNAAVSESEFEIGGLIAGQQYWLHVRSVRGSEYGTWSDPATRVANV